MTKMCPHNKLNQSRLVYRAMHTQTTKTIFVPQFTGKRIRKPDHRFVNFL